MTYRQWIWRVSNGVLDLAFSGFVWVSLGLGVGFHPAARRVGLASMFPALAILNLTLFVVLVLAGIRLRRKASGFTFSDLRHGDADTRRTGRRFRWVLLVETILIAMAGFLCFHFERGDRPGRGSPSFSASTSCHSRGCWGTVLLRHRSRQQRCGAPRTRGARRTAANAVSGVWHGPDSLVFLCLPGVECGSDRASIGSATLTRSSCAAWGASPAAMTTPKSTCSAFQSFPGQRRRANQGAGQAAISSSLKPASRSTSRCARRGAARAARRAAACRTS